MPPCHPHSIVGTGSLHSTVGASGPQKVSATNSWDFFVSYTFIIWNQLRSNPAPDLNPVQGLIENNF
jgi:hypothetical protein